VSRPENQVVSACLAWLKLQGAFVWRNNSRTVMVPGKGGTPRPMFFGLPGSPDILGMLPGGRFVGVECKRALGPRGGANGSVQSEDQKMFQEEVEKTGGLYVLARGLDDLMQAIERKDGAK